MTWTAPATATTGQVVTAAFWNAQIRDNMLETAPAAVTNAGDLVYADGANSLTRLATLAENQIMVSGNQEPVWRANSYNLGDASYAGWGETSFTDFNSFSVGAGTNVTASLVTGTAAMVWYGCRAASNSSGGGVTIISYRVSGATTTASSLTWSAQGESDPATTQFQLSRTHKATLTAGTNVFTLQAAVISGLGTILYPYIMVQPL